MLPAPIRHLLMVASSLLFISVFCAVTCRVLCPDFIQFWTAGKILAAGEDPYDPLLQAAVQKQVGWDQQENGLGIYAFMPFYYPPWLAIICMPLALIGFSAAKYTWFALNALLLLASAWLMKDSFPGVPRSAVLMVFPLFAMSLLCLQLGQTSILVLFLIACSWRLLQGGRDLAAGAFLAWTTIKPQLCAALLVGLMLWSLRHRRWGVLLSLALTGLVLCLASFLVLPDWIGRMLDAPRITPMPVEYFPWNGTTWFLLLKGIGLSGWALYTCYAVVASAALGSTIRLALGESTSLVDVISLGLLATFLIVPYGRAYDFPVLLIPMFRLIGSRLPEIARAALLVVILILPYVQWGWLILRQRSQGSPLQNVEISYLWIPALLIVGWAANALITRKQDRLLSNHADSQCGSPGEL